MLIRRRFCGPPDSANGGYFSGLAAAALGSDSVGSDSVDPDAVSGDSVGSDSVDPDAVSGDPVGSDAVGSDAVGSDAVVTLRLPPPLESELQVRVADGSAVVESDGATIATVAPAQVTDSAPPAVPFELAEAVAGRSPYPDPRDHPFPTCFVCGPAADDGLRLFPGAVPGRDVVAAPWIPQHTLVGADGRVAPEFVWAALDCPSYFGARAADPTIPAATVLGRMSCRIGHGPRVGQRLVVLGWGLGRQGRKIEAGSALYDADGQVLAVARSTWIVLPGAQSPAGL